jgi:PAS domain S-box-containing protein
MRKNKGRYKVLFENNPHPTWVYDVETLRFLEVNKAAIKKYGYSQEEFLRMRILDIRPLEDIGPLMDDLKKKRAEVQSTQRRYCCKDGRVVPVEVTSHLAHLNGRKVAVVVAEDITDRRRSQDALVREKEDAQRATRFKDEFLSMTSHELRTPLNAILGFSELLGDDRYGSLNERQRRYVDNIFKGGRHLLHLINDILDLSKIEAGCFELAIETVRIDLALSEVISAMRPLADRKSQTLTHHADPKVGVRADSMRLKQVLMNLIGNAIKFTPENGHIDVTARLTDGKVRLEVRDTGPGIPADEQARIFEAFYRARKSGEPIEGTGLGLAITQRLVDLHGAKLDLLSEPGEGSCFYFSLPIAADVVQPRQHATKAESRPRSNRPPRILVLEDDPAAEQIITTHLSSSGYEVAHCGKSQHAAAMAANLRPDAITLDLLMRPTNGWEVLLQLKSDPRTASIPVIVVTVVDQPAVGAILGADEYLVKPVQKQALLAAVDRCVKGVTSPTRTILLVEDDGPTREVVTELLTGEGYDVRTAADGAEARASVATELPELVILDLMLPKVSGFELLSEWRTDPRTAELPVFVLTSKDLNREEEKYLRTNIEFLFRKEQPWRDALTKQLHRLVPQAQAVSA